MKQRLLKSSFILALLLTSLLWTHAQANAQRIAVLDWQAAMLESTKIQAELQKADQQLAGEQNRARQLAEEARALQERLQRDGSIMSEDERRRLAQQIEQKAQEYQFVISRLQKQQQEARQEIINRHRPNLEKAVNTLINEKKIDILLDRQAAAFVKPEFDITPAVAEQLNKME